MQSRSALLMVSVISSAYPVMMTQAQDITLGQITILPTREVTQELGFDKGAFATLQDQWPTRAMSDDELLTLGKGWVATSTPSSPTAANGVQILKQLAVRGSPSANLTLGLWGDSPALRPIVGDPKNYLMNAATA